MFNLGGANLEDLIVHHVGNPLKEEGITMSDKSVYVDEEVQNLLMHYFIQPFKKDNLFNLFHEVELPLNEVFHCAAAMFDDVNCRMEQSQNLAKLLYDKTDHPKVKSGEFYVAFFSGCIWEDELVDAIGIFKSENKDTFLKVYQRDRNFDIDHDNGININKLDKGCLIFNTERDEGFVCTIVDAVNKGQEAQYWKDQFLKVRPREDAYFYTDNYLEVYKDFCEEMCHDHVIDRREQAVLLKNGSEYFEARESFDASEFEEEVLLDEKLVENFNDFKEQYKEVHEIAAIDEFPIHEKAVKSKKKFMKHVLKLDNNFSVYIHGDETMIDRGFDEEKHLHYYTLYFDKEA